MLRREKMTGKPLADFCTPLSIVFFGTEIPRHRDPPPSAHRGDRARRRLARRRRNLQKEF